MPVSVNKNSSGGSKPPAPPAVPVTTGDFTINTASLKSALLAAGRERDEHGCDGRVSR